MKKVSIACSLIFLSIGCSNNADTFTFSRLDQSIKDIADNRRPDKNEPICDPFGEGDKPFSARLRGVLTSLGKDLGPGSTLENYLSAGRILSDSVYLSQVNVIPRHFDQGFIDAAGKALLDQNGERLVEYFSLHFLGQLKVSKEQAGLYRLALISDDGARLSLANSEGHPEDVLIDSDGYHSPRMACGEVLSLVEGDPLPIRLDYFQGPRFQMGLMLMWKKIEGGADGTEVQCGRGGNRHFFDTSVSPAMALKPYKRLLTRGWEVVPEQNFVPLGDESCFD